MAKPKIKSIIPSLVSDFLDENGLELYNTEFVKEGPDWFLRVYIDKKEGSSEYVSTDECELVSKFLSAKLDEEDPIEQNYYLEVSSPGMDRELIEEKHFNRYKGEQVDVKLYKGFEGSKFYQGELVGLIDGNIVIKDENDKEIAFSQDQVAKVNLTVIF